MLHTQIHKFGFAHFWSVTLVSTNKTTLFTPPSVLSYIGTLNVTDHTGRICKLKNLFIYTILQTKFIQHLGYSDYRDIK
jgi:hypothetical protein